MKYKISELANLSGVSTRTLRFYDEIGLLVPEKIDANGYRIYCDKQVDNLQLILFYRELGIPLEKIKKIIAADDFDREKALKEHLVALQNRKEQIDKLINNVKKSISSYEEGFIMSDKEKFMGFKKQKINQNEAKYGKEIRKRYGDEVIDESNKKIMNLSEQQWTDSKELEAMILKNLEEAFKLGDPESEVAQHVCDLHRQWLCMFWKDGTYSKQAHFALAEGYVSDERFTAYYDRIGKGCTKFLRDAIKIYCKEI